MFEKKKLGTKQLHQNCLLKKEEKKKERKTKKKKMSGGCRHLLREWDVQ